MSTSRTWAITIYRQTLLPGLDFADMTHGGVLATILSGLEPAVAIVLACIPLLRPLFGKSRELPHSSYHVNSSRTVSLFSKKGSKIHGRDPTATFSELMDNDDSSEIELQPIKLSRKVCISSIGDSHLQRPYDTSSHAITVEREWEVTRD